jgi:hypothetical protein
MTYTRFKAELDAVEAMRRMGWLLHLSRVGGLPYLMGLFMMWKHAGGFKQKRMAFSQVLPMEAWE